MFLLARLMIKYWYQEVQLENIRLIIYGCYTVNRFRRAMLGGGY